MASQAEIDALIAAMLANAAGPAAASNETGSVTSRSLGEQIEAIKFLAQMKAARNPFAAMKTTQIAPSGTVFSHDQVRYVDPREVYPRRFY